MKLPGETQWSQAVVSSKIAPRSYKVEVNGRFYRRNRKQLRSTKEPLQESPSEIDDDDLTTSNNLREQTQPFPASTQAKVATTPPRPRLFLSPRTTELSARPPQVATTTEIIKDEIWTIIKPPKKFDIES